MLEQLVSIDDSDDAIATPEPALGRDQARQVLSRGDRYESLSTCTSEKHHDVVFRSRVSHQAPLYNDFMGEGFRERREFQRLMLEEPCPASFGDVDAKIIEIGVLGARLVHEEPVTEGEVRSLGFESDGKKAAMECQVVRTRTPASGPRYETGVRFLGAIGESDATVRSLLQDTANRMLERLYSSLRDPGDVEFDDDDTLRGREAGFVTYYMQDGEWHKKYSMLPDQPESGFTVAVGEDELEMKRLRQLYEEADTDGMQLIRLFAELSIAEAMGVPRKATG